MSSSWYATPPSAVQLWAAAEPCFRLQKVLEIPRQPRHALHRPVSHLICAILPTAGRAAPRAADDFCIVTIAGGYTGDVVLLGMDAMPVTSPEDYRATVITHLARILALRYCEDAKIVLDVPTGTGLEAGHIIKLVQDAHPGRVIALGDFARKPGTLVTLDSRMLMMRQTRFFIDNNRVYIPLEFLSNTPAILEQLCTQLLAYKQVDEHKLSGRGPGRDLHDELSQGLQQAIFAKCRFEGISVL